MQRLSSQAKFKSPTFGFKDKKWAGVRVIPEFMSSPIYTSGCELMMASASFKTVKSWSLVKHSLPIAFRKDRFTRPISRS